MSSIHILDSETIDKIAAGEVVERPASVVKELVENAIDAGATAITVEAKEGGIEFLRITDNGCGMEPEQIRTAFLRHATSKIESAQDLVRVSSLGFRGEALSSIAAVSKVEVITKTPQALTGVRYVLEGAVEKSFEEVGAPTGTTFLMRNLFFNTPVRRKFLKQPSTEGGYITDLMEHLALSRPDISFKFLLGSQVRFHTSGNGDLKEVIYRIYGRDIAMSLVPVSREKDGVRIEGYLGKPVLVRSNRNFEIYFINGRFIKSQLLARAIEEGYKEYLMQHKFPLCVLHIRMDTGNVDVNVHPAKMDVRFSDGPAFCNLLSGAVRETLRRKEMIPDASLEDEKKGKTRSRAAAVPEPFEKVRAGQYKVMEEVRYEADKPKMQDLLQNPVWSRVVNGGSGAAKSQKLMTALDGTDKEKAPEEDFFVEAGPLGESRQGGREDHHQPAEYFEAAPEDLVLTLSQNREQAAVPDDLQKQTATPAGHGEHEPEGKAAPAMQMNLFEEKLLTRDNRSRYRILGQVFDTYWLLQFEDKLLIIDQHAAHEKVKYERLMKQYHEHEVISQSLFPPIIISLTGQEETVLKEYMETFRALGFEIESFGGNEYALRSVPVDLYGCGEREMFLEVLDELSEGPLRNNLKVVEEKIASMSCKAAVKGNNRLSRPEAEKLIDELLTLENPYNCPHGRPTIISMTKTEMEKKFKRIV